MTTLYIHGFASTGDSRTAARLREILGPAETVIAPTLTHRPVDDIMHLVDLMRAHEVTTIVGSSLGGFYALALGQWSGARAVLLNPALRPWETLAGAVGTVSVYGTSETFAWSERELQELCEIGDTVEYALDPQASRVAWRSVLVLLGARDEVVDPAVTAKLLARARVIVDPEAGHRFDNLTVHADAIRAIAVAAFDNHEHPDVWGDD